MFFHNHPCSTIRALTGKVSVLAEKETRTYPWVIEPLLGTLAVMIFFFFAFRNYGGVPMDLKELFELVGMAGLVAAMILFTVFSKGREARVRKKIYKSIRIFRGKADVGAYYLSEEFIEQLMLGKEYEFDEETLSEAGLTILQDRKYRGEKFIGIQRMGREDRSIR